MSDNTVRTKDLVFNKKFPTVILVESVQVLDGYCVRVKFNDGVEKEIDLEPILWGPVFEPIRNDPDFFRQVYVDPVGKTLTWPNNVDLDPDSLYYGDTEAPWWTEYKRQQAKKKSRQPKERVTHKTTNGQRKTVTAQESKKRAVKPAVTRKKVLAKSK